MCQILIAEDEPRIAAFIEKGLRKHGYSTLIAQDGAKAVELVLAHSIDLLLLDLGLPIKDGWKVLEELQSRQQKPPVIIIVTARDEGSERVNRDRFDIDGYVVKPFRFNDLLAQVQAQLRPH
ncbi:MAG: response regulator [Leptolyngbyaceae cyanobacterium SL_7_1]|nr:response regulator [Leptolyngbyaceae cyanobacterium SL_7_1]